MKITLVIICSYKQFLSAIKLSMGKPLNKKNDP